MSKIDTVKNEEVFRKAFANLHLAAVAIVLVRTREPHRAIDNLKKFAFGEKNLEFKEWWITHGWSTHDKNDKSKAAVNDEETIDPVSAIKAVNEITNGKQWGNGIYVMAYPHLVNMSKNPVFISYLKRYAKLFSENSKRIVLITPPTYELPTELEDDIAILDFDPPSRIELLDTYNKIINLLPEEKRPKFTKNDANKIISIGAGMTQTEFENSVSRALIEHRELLPKITIDDVCGVLSTCKSEVIKKTDVLEIMEPVNINEVGGLQPLKDWLEDRKYCFLEEARAFGISYPRGITLVGAPGCIAEGTLISYNRGKRHSSRVLSIEDFCNKFNKIGSYAAPKWLSDVDTKVHSFDPETGKVFYNKVNYVLYSGTKLCIRVTTDTAGYVELTKDHPVLTANGTFLEAEYLNVGDELLVRGNMKPASLNKERVYRPRKMIEGLKYYCGGSNKYVKEAGKVYTYQRQYQARLMIEAHMNKLEYDEYIKILKQEPEKAESLVLLPKDYDVHHINEDPMDDRLNNLQVLLSEEHRALHGHGGQHRFNVDFTSKATIVSIENIGEKKTFDISMENPLYCNFAVNDGIIVHNTGKSLVAKATANMLGLPLIRFDVSRVFQSLVGSSEARVRNTLKIVETCAPCVTEDTWIKLENGQRKTVGQLWESNSKQMMIDTMCPDTGKNIKSQLLGIIKKPVGNRKVLEIVAGKKTIKVTDNHKLLIWKNDYPIWVEAKNLKKGDNLVQYSESRLNLVGKTIGMFKIIGLAEPKNEISRWHVECKNCKTKTIRTHAEMKIRKYPLCGCGGKRPGTTTHKMSNSKEYRIWNTMHRRCYEKNFKDYHYYGKRGIKICERWHKNNPNGFRNFFSDMGICPSKKTLDRINNDYNYTPNNCKWSTRKEQANNFRKNKILEWQGEKKTLSQWSEDSRIKGKGISYTTLRARLNVLRWDFAKAATTPVQGESI